MSLWKWFFHQSRRNDPLQGRPRTSSSGQMSSPSLLQKHADMKLTGSVEDAIGFIRPLLGENGDFVIRRFEVFSKYPAVMFYFTGIINRSMVNAEILKPLMYLPPHLEGKDIEASELQRVLLHQTLYQSESSLEQGLPDIVEAVLVGKIAVVIEGMPEAFIIGSRSVEKRSIEQPQTEQVIQGPREGFVEPIETNLSLLRYRLPTPNFRVQMMRIGRMTKTLVSVCFLEGIVNPDLVKEVKERLAVIDIDGILDSGYIEQFIEDHPYSPFPQVLTTEKSDKAVANLLEGRVVILVDGSPFALILPTVFSQFYQTTEDYSSRFLQGSFVRLARVVALIFSLIFPALYVAIISYNPELIPTEFAVAVAGGRAGVPFPSFIEVFIMEVSMEVLREATIRLPQQVGGALSIVGVLVIGEAAVSAGFASPITVVVIALTTIGSFATPAYNAAFALRMLRFPLIILAGMFGLYGVMIGLILIVNHLISLKSFGIPYLSPAVPGNFQGMKDLLIRSPLWFMKNRPTQLRTSNKQRVGNTPEEIKQSHHDVLDPN